MNDFQKNALLIGIGIIAGFVIALFVLDDSERERQITNRMLEAESRIKECTNCNASAMFLTHTMAIVCLAIIVVGKENILLNKLRK